MTAKQYRNAPNDPAGVLDPDNPMVEQMEKDLEGLLAEVEQAQIEKTPLDSDLSDHPPTEE